MVVPPILGPYVPVPLSSTLIESPDVIEFILISTMNFSPSVNLIDSLSVSFPLCKILPLIVLILSRLVCKPDGRLESLGTLT